MSNFFSNIFRRNVPQPQVEERSTTLIVGLPIGSTFFGGSGNALSHPVVMLCMQLIEDNISKCGFTLTKNVGNKKQKIEDSWLSNPNRGRLTQYHFIKMILHSLLSEGNAYALLERDKNKEITAIHYLPTSVVTVIAPDNYLTDNPQYQVNGLGIVPYENILHFGAIPTETVYQFTSPVALCSKALSDAQNAETTHRRWLKNSAQIFGILRANKALRTELKESIKQQWKNAVDSTDGTGLVLSEIDLDYLPIANNSNGNVLAAVREYETVEVCRIFNVDTAYVFAPNANSYASLEAKLISFLTTTLYPWVERILTEFNRKLKAQGYTVEFDDSDFNKGDLNSTADYLRKMSQGLMTTNECRQRLGLPAVENGDKLFVQGNLIEISHVAQGHNCKEALQIKPNDE